MKIKNGVGTPTDPLPGGGFEDPDNPGGGGGSGYTAFEYFLTELSNEQNAWLASYPTIRTQILITYRLMVNPTMKMDGIIITMLCCLHNGQLGI